MFQGLEASADYHLLARSSFICSSVCFRSLHIRCCLTGGGGLKPVMNRMRSLVGRVLNWGIDAAPFIKGDFNGESKTVKTAIKGEDSSRVLTGGPNSAFQTNLKI